jgi:hypothetical protein
MEGHNMLTLAIIVGFLWICYCWLDYRAFAAEEDQRLAEHEAEYKKKWVATKSAAERTPGWFRDVRVGD